MSFSSLQFRSLVSIQNSKFQVAAPKIKHRDGWFLFSLCQSSQSGPCSAASESLDAVPLFRECCGEVDFFKEGLAALVSKLMLTPLPGGAARLKGGPSG